MDDAPVAIVLIGEEGDPARVGEREHTAVGIIRVEGRTSSRIIDSGQAAATIVAVPHEAADRVRDLGDPTAPIIGQRQLPARRVGDGSKHAQRASARESERIPVPIRLRSQERQVLRRGPESPHRPVLEPETVPVAHGREHHAPIGRVCQVEERPIRLLPKHHPLAGRQKQCPLIALYQQRHVIAVARPPSKRPLSRPPRVIRPRDRHRQPPRQDHVRLLQHKLPGRQIHRLPAEYLRQRRCRAL